MLTVERLIRLVLPYGSNAEYEPSASFPEETLPNFEKYWQKPPNWPGDMFAIIAMLAKRTGAYTFVKPGLPYEPDDTSPIDLRTRKTSDPFGIFGREGDYRFDLTVLGHVWRHGLILIDSDEIDDSGRRSFLKNAYSAIDEDPRMETRVKAKVRTLAKDKSKRIQCYDTINRLWSKLIKNHKHDEIIHPTGPWEDFKPHRQRQQLFSIILKLLIISDEACTGIAQYYDPEKPMPWIINILNDDLEQKLEDARTEIEHKRHTDPEATYHTSLADRVFTFAADQNVTPVLPKARTTSLGCALRSLCRNVCLAPMSTEVDARWITMEGSKKDGLFNLLLIPFPFSMPHGCFKPYLSEAQIKNRMRNRNWRWFDIDQMWLPESGADGDRIKLIEQFVGIIEAAIALNNEINGVVLPEGALDFDLFNRLADRLASIDEIEVLIAGTSTAPLSRLLHDDTQVIKHGGEYKHGNFVSTAIYLPPKPGTSDATRYDISVQHKHHRWKLNKQQIIDYGAAFQLDPAYDWWENINISTRKLNFWSFRQHSVLATLICEDLARTDPAQQVIRSIGPSLLISILMDGPQFKQRWPGLYASSLSQDPGCSVLTMTSLGLLKDRPNGGRFKPTRNIALWADQTSGVQEISLSEKAVGVVLNITGNPAATRSLDGRYQLQSARQWELVGIKDVFLPHGVDSTYREKPGIFNPYRNN